MLPGTHINVQAVRLLSMAFIWVLIVLLFCLACWLSRLNRDYALTSLTRRIKTLDGSPIEQAVDVACGFWGNTFDVIAMDLEQYFAYSCKFADKFNRSYIKYFIPTPIYCILDANDAELVLNDTRLLTKSKPYRYLHPFMHQGLVTSTGAKWHTRRRILTPTFHFNILKQFMDVFRRESLKFIDMLNGHIESTGTETVISLTELIPSFTFNNICETAMGVSLDNCSDGDEYRRNFTAVDETFCKRLQNPLKQFDWLYFRTKEGKRYLETMDKLHRVSSGVIEKRRKLLQTEMRNQEFENHVNNNDVYQKKRYAMLDTLLLAEQEGLIDHAGICEEVDTFLSAGFDTTSISLTFALMCLSLYPQLQQKCYDEIKEHFNDDLSNLDMQQLNKLKYLDCFIKESQRLYPTAPFVARECSEDMPLANNLLLPKGTQVVVDIYHIHRSTKYYKDPCTFNPERFMSPDGDGRHPYAFIPFSAGQRNCIGQKFALLEEKTLLVHILKNFILEPFTSPNTLRFAAGILLRTKSNIQIKIKKRE